MSNLISREKAIEAVVCHIWHMPNESYKLFNCENVIREVVKDAFNRFPLTEVLQLKQTDTLIIAVALQRFAEDEERHELDRARAEKLREQILEYGASMCHAEPYKGGELK